MTIFCPSLSLVCGVILFVAQRVSTVVLYRFAIRPRVWPSPTTWICSAEAGEPMARIEASTVPHTSAFGPTIRWEQAIWENVLPEHRKRSARMVACKAVFCPILPWGATLAFVRNPRRPELRMPAHGEVPPDRGQTPYRAQYQGTACATSWVFAKARNARIHMFANDALGR